jgi:hypothetical protein
LGIIIKTKERMLSKGIYKMKINRRKQTGISNGRWKDIVRSTFRSESKN